MACIVHTGHDQGECWREHSGTTGWQKNLKTWFFIRVLTKILKDLAERIFCLTFQYRKKKWKGRITIICKHTHIFGTFWFSKPFLSRGFVKRTIYVRSSNDMTIWNKCGDFQLIFRTKWNFFGRMIKKKLVQSSYISNVS